MITGSLTWAFGTLECFSSCSQGKCWKRACSCFVCHLLWQKSCVQKVREHTFKCKNLHVLHSLFFFYPALYFCWDTISKHSVAVKPPVWFELFVASKVWNAASNHSAQMFASQQWPPFDVNIYSKCWSVFLCEEIADAVMKCLILLTVHLNMLHLYRCCRRLQSSTQHQNGSGRSSCTYIFKYSSACIKASAHK